MSLPSNRKVYSQRLIRAHLHTRTIARDNAVEEPPAEGNLTNPTPSHSSKATCFFSLLPAELRNIIWEYVIPRRVLRVHSLAVYCHYGRELSSSCRPTTHDICVETKRMISSSGIYVRFMNSDLSVAFREWYDRYRDILYIQSIRIFVSWNNWERILIGSTIAIHVLETIEDLYRGTEASRNFGRAIKRGHFNNVHKFLLILLVVEWDGDIDGIYGDDDTTFLGLDDKRLPNILRPVFADLRARSPDRMVHKRPSCLLRHLHKEWDNSLRSLFEEHWIQANVGLREAWGGPNPPPHRETFDSGERFEFRNARPRMKRHRPLVRPVVEGMPAMQPVIAFEKKQPSFATHYDPFAYPSRWNECRSGDGLVSISNRRRLALTWDQLAGRKTLYPNNFLLPN
ncbi:hypothetical protein GGS23DRAFT_565714 [Durotheca rogersii]|uniref:uncharacterized protein n=1 Tax=Durotheca rogersii TaxID=419775 RepID=UPI00221F0699|nr:uncharacterized protein GGS23DRAFT_565714 [Durotheca rogersii]KAI5863860.1 hypothetical protein GGS23DRAFT_565714 [Durotheca rogersii]